jgi:tetratricopeptide (TPR) repeat protein
MMWPGFATGQNPALPAGAPAEAPEREAGSRQANDAGLELARDALRRAQWPDAERAARGYLQDHEGSAEGHYLLALALFRENHPRESLAEYTHAARLQRPTALQLRWVALDYVLLGAYKDADTWMSKSLEWNPEDGESWYELGRIKYSEGRFGEAVEAFNKALRLLPRSVKAENNLGLADEGLNRPDDAIAAYQQALAWQAGAASRSEQPMLNLGILLTDKYRLDEALPLLREAESIAPGDSKIHAALGKLYERKNDLAHAQAEFEQAVGLDSKSAGLHFQLGQVYRKLGEKGKAAGEFAQASALDGTHSSDSQ